MSTYADRFWKKSWDEGVRDLEPREYETTYPELIRPAMDRFARETALIYMGRDITFSELDGYANRFANTLVANGFTKGDVVGIHLPNLPEYLISVIGTLRAGCVVSGVSPLLSPAQIAYQLGDLGAGGKQVALVTLDMGFEERIEPIAPELDALRLVVTTSVGGFLPGLKKALGKLARKIPTGPVHPLEGKVLLDFHRDVLKKGSALAPEVQVTPDDVGYIQYTGGTTGPPKGAILNYRNVAHNIQSIIRWMGWGMGEGVLLSGFPMFHIAGLTIAQAAVFAGWPQVLVPNPRDTKYICDQMVKRRVTNLVNVPSLFQLLMANPAFRAMDHSRLGTCICAASPFPRESQEELEKIIGAGKLLELYGMTETSPVSCMNPSRGPKKLGAIGTPFLNVECKLVDPGTGEEVPLGQPGEICIRGPLVMQGYYNKPEETQAAIDEDGYMHTGDVAIMDEDGYLRIVDRTKDMIIVGGYKVFSSKVEEALAAHPAVGSLALVGVPNPSRPGSELVKAFVQIAPDYPYDGNEEALAQELTSFARERCSPYEIPKLVEILAEMPLTAVGKIDKKVLRAKAATDSP